MESLIKQTRSRFAGTRQDNKDARSSTIDRKVQPQKTQSFKERKRNLQSWIRSQFSRQMSSDYDFSDADYPAAVAAATYAIQSLPESKSKYQKETTYGRDTRVPNEPLKSALKSSDETSKKSCKDPDNKTPTSKKTVDMKRTSFADKQLASEVAPSSMQRPPTFADKQLDKTNGKNPETTVPNPNHRTAQTLRQMLGKEEMTSIKKRYEKLMATIDDWETKKKKRAKRKIERTEAELDKRRAKSIQSHRNEIVRIEGIARGARTQGDKNRRKEESKVKEKANKIRLTGKIPATCWCF